MKCFEQIIEGKVGVELSGDSTFQYFRQEGEVGDGPEVAHGVKVESRSFEDGCDRSRLGWGAGGKVSILFWKN